MACGQPVPKPRLQRAAKLPTVQRPRVYGNETKLRSAVARHIETGEELLDQGTGVRNRLTAIVEQRDMTSADVLTAVLTSKHGWGWDGELRKWARSAGKTMATYLADQFDAKAPVLARGLPPDTGKPRHTITLDNGQEWLRLALEELRQLQAALGVRRDVVSFAPPTPARFVELNASGLVNQKVIRDHAHAMAAPRTPKQLKDAIGSAKELTEATLRAALDRFDESYGDNEDLPRLMRKWRKAIDTQGPPDPKGADTLDKSQAALANLVTFLAEWRNTYGSGHGRSEYPPGLAARHARLAADAAETCIRFIVTTMDDLELLPPPSP
jgi:hypothetical protein